MVALRILEKIEAALATKNDLALLEPQHRVDWRFFAREHLPGSSVYLIERGAGAMHEWTFSATAELVIGALLAVLVLVAVVA